MSITVIESRQLIMLLIGSNDQVNTDKIDDENTIVDMAKPPESQASRNPRVKVDVAVKFGSKWHKKKVSDE